MQAGIIPATTHGFGRPGVGAGFMPAPVDFLNREILLRRITGWKSSLGGRIQPPALLGLVLGPRRLKPYGHL